MAGGLGSHGVVSSSETGRVKRKVAPRRRSRARHEPDAATVELDDLAAHRQADARAGELLLGMEALEDHEDPDRRSAGAMPMLLSADREGGGLPPPRHRACAPTTAGCARGASPRNLIALANRFWQQRGSNERPPRTCRQRTADSRAALRTPRSLTPRSGLTASAATSSMATTFSSGCPPDRRARTRAGRRSAPACAGRRRRRRRCTGQAALVQLRQLAAVLRAPSKPQPCAAAPGDRTTARRTAPARRWSAASRAPYPPARASG